MINLAIVITAYNRPESLKNLLDNLLTININENIPLIIGIDNNGTPEVNNIAKSYVWPYGEKKIVIQSSKNGLVKQFIWAGDQSIEYGNVIFLEDDLLVAPDMVEYTKQMLEFYNNNPHVAAGSLYNPILCEGTGEKFYQIQDDSDVYFLQQPYWGHVWIKDKWNEFKEFLKTYVCKPEILPSGIASWTHSFKKIYIQFLIEKNYYVVTPRISLVTNNGVAGLHGKAMFAYQNTLQLNKHSYRFIDFSKSISIYDAFEEILPEILKNSNSQLKDFEFTVDIKGLKNRFDTPYVLTTKKSSEPVLEFSSLMKPTELSVFMNQTGDRRLVLAKAADIINDKKYYRKYRYFDIIKNYHIGIITAYYIFINDFFGYGVYLAKNKLKKWLRLKKN